MAKHQKRQPPIKSKPVLSPEECLSRVLALARPSLETIAHLVQQGRVGMALETAFLYGLSQGIRLARQEMKSAKQIESAIDDLFGDSQTEVNLKGKSMEEAQKDVQKAVDKDQRPTIWTPEGEV